MPRTYIKVQNMDSGQIKIPVNVFSKLLKDCRQNRLGNEKSHKKVYYKVNQTHTVEPNLNKSHQNAPPLNRQVSYATCNIPYYTACDISDNKNPNNKCLFKYNLDQYLKKSRYFIPPVIKESIHFLNNEKFFKMPGFFRRPGNAKQVLDMKKAFIDGYNPFVVLNNLPDQEKYSESNRNTVCSLLQNYLSSVEGKLIPFKISEELISVQKKRAKKRNVNSALSSDQCCIKSPEMTTAIKKSLKKLSKNHQINLRLLLQLLSKISTHQVTNNMTPNNLSVCLLQSVMDLDTCLDEMSSAEDVAKKANYIKEILSVMIELSMHCELFSRKVVETMDLHRLNLDEAIWDTVSVQFKKKPIIACVIKSIKGASESYEIIQKFTDSYKYVILAIKNTENISTLDDYIWLYQPTDKKKTTWLGGEVARCSIVGLKTLKETHRNVYEDVRKICKFSCEDDQVLILDRDSIEEYKIEDVRVVASVGRCVV